MTKFLSDDWMYENGFLSETQLIDSYTPKLIPSKAWGKEHTVADLTLNPPVTIHHHATIKQAITKMQNLQFHQLPVLNEENKIMGVITSASLIEAVNKGKVSLDSPITKAIVKAYRKISSTTPISELSRVFTRVGYAIVDEKYIVTHSDFLTFFKDNDQ